MIRSERRDRFVYFARRVDDTGAIKIGNSTSPSQRLRELNLTCDSKLKMLAYAPGGFKDETAVHIKFTNHRLSGEWFEPTDDLLSFIAAVAATRALPLRPCERRAEVFSARYLAGETYQQIANDHGITRERVRQILRSHGVAPIPLKARRATLPLWGDAPPGRAAVSREPTLSVIDP